MPVYNPPLRDMQFVMHEVLNVTEDLKSMPQHADTDAETINAVLEEAGKFASQVIFPLNISGDTEGCQLDTKTHEVTTPKGFKEAYKTYVDGGWAALSCGPEFGGQGVPVVVSYHPAYLLRTPQDKAKAWADLCLALDVMQRGEAAPA